MLTGSCLSSTVLYQLTRRQGWVSKSLSPEEHHLMAAPITEPGASSRRRGAGCYVQQPRRLPCTLAGSEGASPFPSSPSHSDSHHHFTHSSSWESTGTQFPGPRLGGHSSSWQSWCHWSSQENAVVEDCPFQFDPSQRGMMTTPGTTCVGPCGALPSSTKSLGNTTGHRRCPLSWAHSVQGISWLPPSLKGTGRTRTAGAVCKIHQPLNSPMFRRCF